MISRLSQSCRWQQRRLAFFVRHLYEHHEISKNRPDAAQDHYCPKIGRFDLSHIQKSLHLQSATQSGYCTFTVRHFHHLTYCYIDILINQTRVRRCLTVTSTPPASRARTQQPAAVGPVMSVVRAPANDPAHRHLGFCSWNSGRSRP